MNSSSSSSIPDISPSSASTSSSSSTSLMTTPPKPTAQSTKKLSKLQMLQKRMKEDPVVFGFLGLTVLALTGGLVSLIRNDRKQSQMMMRARVFFQFCAVSSLVGGIYYRAYNGTLDQKSGKPLTDKRLYLTDPMPALQADPVHINNTPLPNDKSSKELR